MTIPSKSGGILSCLSAIFIVWLYLLCIASGFADSLFFLAFQLPIPMMICLLFLVNNEGCRHTGWAMFWVWTALTLMLIIRFQCRPRIDPQDELLFIFHPIYFILYPIYIAIITPIITGLYFAIAYIWRYFAKKWMTCAKP